MTEPTACESRRAKIISFFDGKHNDLLEAHLECSEEGARIRIGLQTIGELIHISPPENGNSREWKELVARAEAERVVLGKHLDGKALFTAILRLYAALHRELGDSILPAQQTSTEEFREQRRRKRNPSDDQAKKSKINMPTPGSRDSKPRPQGEMATKNFFSPLTTAEMEIEHAPVEGTSDDPNKEPQQTSASKAGRPPPIVLTSTTNLMTLQKHIKDIVTGNFEFRNTRSGTRIVTKEMADFSAIRKYLEKNNLSYCTFLPKSEKPIEVVIRHLPSNTPAQDISDGLVDLGFDIISVKQMSASRRSTSEGSVPQNLPVFLITLPRTLKSKEIFRLTALCHIVIRVEAYMAQSGLTQCQNCQQFGHVWANCKQSPRCLWCGGGNLHKNARRMITLPPLQLTVTASWRRERNPIQPTIGYAGTRGRSCRKGRSRKHPKLQRGRCSPTSLRQVSTSRRRSEAVQPNNNHRHARFPGKPPLMPEQK
jgi:hypothetical protein